MGPDDMVKKIQGLPTKIQRGSAALRIKTVCDTCNNGWMSRLEQETIPVLRPLVNDISIPLSSDEQILLAGWATKTGMVLDSIYKHGRFFDSDQCKDMRERRIIPNGTTIWIGRFFGNGKHAGLDDFSLDSKPDPKVGKGCVITLILGRVIFQSFNTRFNPEHKHVRFRIPCRPGKWAESLTQIWPNAGGQIRWPPPMSFTLYSEVSVGSLIHRFKPIEL